MSCFNLFFGFFLGGVGYGVGSILLIWSKTWGGLRGNFLCCKDSIPGYYIFFYKTYSDPMTEINISVKEEKKIVFTFFIF